MKHVRWLVAVLGLPGLIACSNIQASYVPLGDATLTPAPDDKPIPILKAPPDRPYQKLARLKVVAENPTDHRELLDALIEEGRKVGADAIMSVDDSHSQRMVMMQQGNPGQPAGEFFIPMEIDTMTAIAIKYQ